VSSIISDSDWKLLDDLGILFLFEENLHCSYVCDVIYFPREATDILNLSAKLLRS
jgi:hypothetical protein